jgi:hypothetical protein
MRLIVTLLCLLFPGLCSAQDWTSIGTARLFTNDVIGDGYDRWRTGSYQLSWLIAPARMDPAAPEGFVELRFRSDVLTPSFELPNGTVDRPYAGALSFGVHAHHRRGAVESSFGLDTMFIGPSTGLSGLQADLHDLFSLPDPIGADGQLPDAVHFGATAEIAARWHPTPRLTIRPFAEAQRGIEDLVRVGFDVIAGPVGHDGIYVRDVGTGTLMRAAGPAETGLALIAGADIARVSDSVFLPRDLGFAPQEFRWRARLGVMGQLQRDVTLFAGLTWLAPEFVNQPEGQLLGSLRLNFNF